MEGLQVENSDSRDSSISNFSDTNCEDFLNSQHGIISTKLPYTLEEDQKILRFVLQNENIYKTGSILLWKKLEYKMDKPKRTYQSLKNRFLRNIKPKIFTTFQDLILDFETEQKILNKFPELNSSFKKSQFSKKCKQLDVCFEGENDVSSGNLVKFKFPKMRQSPHCTPAVNIFGSETHLRKTVIEKDLIKVTVNVISPSPEKKTPKFVGIYEKYLNLKASDSLVPCSYCGGTGTVKKDLETDSSEDEDRLVIDCSYESTSKKSNSRIDESIQSLNSERKSQSEKPKSQDVSSPSLLNCSYRQESKSSDIGRKSNSSSTSEEKLSNSSQNIISDKELEKLYEETVANREIFMDFEDKETNKKIDMKMLKSKSLQPVVSLEKINVESFFFDSD